MGSVLAGELSDLMLKHPSIRATETDSSMEIICISCWRAFDHDTSTAAAQVSCPHCGFSQPGPDPSSLSAKLDANTRPSEIATKSDESEQDASTTDPEMPVMQASEPKEAPKASPTPPAPASTSRPETMDFGAVPPDASSPPPASPLIEKVEEKAPPKPDRRWRLKTPTAMVLYFPDYEAMSRYLNGEEGSGYSVACGPGPFRTLAGFVSAMRVTNDPLEALVNVPPDDETAPMGSNVLSPPTNASPQATQSAGNAGRAQSKPKTGPNPANEANKSAQVKPRTRRRRTSATADFSFRKTQEKNPWPSRILFLAIGIAAGGAAVYYVAWIGLLPGIVY